MSQVFSEINKINNVWTPALGSSGSAHAPSSTAHCYETDIVNMKLYKRCTFIVSAGALVEQNHMNIKVMASLTSTGGGVQTAIPFYYREQGSTETAAYTSGGDIPGTLTVGTTAGFDTSSGGVGAVYIVEVDAATVAAVGAGYDHVKLYITGSTQADDPRQYSMISILSEPRYPQAILDTAID